MAKRPHNKVGDIITCSCCSKEFHKHNKVGMQCRECCNTKRRKYYHRTKGLIWKRYEKTKKGFLMRLYRNMLSRVRGVTVAKNHLYLGLEILDKKDFYKWSLELEEFHDLFKEWEESDYDRRLTPSVDRIDSRFGYILTNMEWVPFHENCRNIRRF